jgi:hypothetical protein
VYSTCLFCHADLGANESVEQFPVGRRLAFDAAKGRLWVVCRRCERWNLTPLEERWEAIEVCERLFAATRLRVSTENIGLARLREGLELVRIGEPQRPEMAAWRYGDQFGRRRRRHIALTGGGVAVAALIIGVGPASGLIAGGGGWGLYNVATSIHNVYQQRRVRARIAVPAFARPVVVRLRHLHHAAIVPGPADGWALHVMFEDPSGRTHVPWRWTDTSFTRNRWRKDDAVVLNGADALRAAGQLLPSINEAGAKAHEVQSAVRLMEEVAEPARLFGRYVRKPGPPIALQGPKSGHTLANLPKEIRLALEMAAHEETERRALEGELAILEAAWRDAEEIASIADDLLVTDATRERLGELRDGREES